jgi:hypothetical protein
MPVSMRTLAALAGLTVLATPACKKRSEPATAERTTTATSPARDAAAEVRIADVEVGRRLGANKRVAEETETFSPRDTIFASVVTEGSAPGATISARWTYEDGQVVKEDSRTISPAGTEATEFHISKPGGWPKGKYKVAITVGGSTETEDFEVR